MTLPSPDGVQIVFTLSTVTALWVGWVKALRPKWRRFWDRINGVVDTLNGRDEFVDMATGRRVPAVQPLGTRIGGIEQTLAVVADQQRTLGDHETRIKALEDTRVEKIVSSAERAATAASSAEMLRMVRERDTFDGHATEPSGEVES